MTSNESRLVRRSLAGSGDAAAALFRRHWPDVWRVAYTVLGDRASADDIAQEAMIRAFTNLDSFDTRQRLAPWLKRIAFNRAIDEVRRRHDIPAGGAGELEFEAIAQVTEAPELEAAGEVGSAVARLTLEQRTIIVLHYWLDCSREEIAEILDIPVGTVASRLGRGLAQIRSQLEEEHVNTT